MRQVGLHELCMRRQVGLDLFGCLSCFWVCVCGGGGLSLYLAEKEGVAFGRCDPPMMMLVDVRLSIGSHPLIQPE